MRKIAVVGLAGVGKSYYIDKKKKEGFTVLSADKFFKKEYVTNKEMIEKARHLGVVKKDIIDVEVLRKHYLAIKDEFESIIYPYLYKEIEKGYDYVELPKSKVNNLFLEIKEIIVPEETRKKRLQKRGWDIKYIKFIDSLSN